MFWAKNLALNKPRTDYVTFQATGASKIIIQQALVNNDTIFSTAGNRGRYWTIDWGTGQIYNHPYNINGITFAGTHSVPTNINTVKIKASPGTKYINTLTAPTTGTIRWTGSLVIPNTFVPQNTLSLSVTSNNLTGLYYGSGIGLSTVVCNINKISHFDEYSNLSGIVTTLNLSTNQLKIITLPTGMPNVTFITVGSNFLTGNLTLPIFAPKLASLTAANMNLDDSRCNFPTGYISLQTLTISTNNFSGINIYTWTGLQNVGIDTNKLTGLILPDYVPLLNALSLSAASSTMETFILPSTATGMKTLTLSSLTLTGIVIPGYTGLSFLQTLGNTPSSSRYLSGLVFLDGFSLYKDTTFNLSSSRITGFINFPTSFTGGTNIQLQTNFLTGFSLPTGGTIWNLSGNVLNNITNIENNPNFRFLYLSGNRLGQNQLDYILGATYTGSTNFGIARSGIVDIRYNLGTLSASGLAYSGLLTGSGWNILA